MLDKKKFYINGEWVSPKKPNDFKVTDPSTEEECAVISLGEVEDVNDAVSAATKAFETWAFSTKEERLKYLEALYVVYKNFGLACSIVNQLATFRERIQRCFCKLVFNKPMSSPSRQNEDLSYP